MAVKMRPDDPAYWMLFDGVETTPIVHSDSCYICRDPEFARMGLPLCRKCPHCGGHIAADDDICDDCGESDYPDDLGGEVLKTKYLERRQTMSRFEDKEDRDD